MQVAKGNLEQLSRWKECEVVGMCASSRAKRERDSVCACHSNAQAHQPTPEMNSM